MIVVQSDKGPRACAINCEHDSRGFIFENGESELSVVRGITIKNGRAQGNNGGAISCIGGSNPTISKCIFLNNYATAYGGAFSSDSWSTSRQLITHCIFAGNRARLGGAVSCHSDTLITNCIITGNIASIDPQGGAGGGIYYLGSGMISITNCIISGNEATNTGGGIGCHGMAPTGTVTITNCLIRQNAIISSYAGGGGIGCSNLNVAVSSCTLIENSAAARGGAVYCENEAVVSVCDSILQDNEAPSGAEIYLHNTASGDDDPTQLSIEYSNLDGGPATTVVESGCILIWGAGLIDVDALFVTGPEGCQYLSQLSAGQPVDSPCVDAGSTTADLLCIETTDSSGQIVTSCLEELTTRTDHLFDSSTADLGYHHGNSLEGLCRTLSTELACSPLNGTLPMNVLFSISLTNRYTGQIRRLAGYIDVTLANGTSLYNWRRGFTQIGSGESLRTTFSQTIPVLGSVVGDNLFELVAEDVTPAPYNQPPYLPAGATDMSACIVTGIAP